MKAGFVTVQGVKSHYIIHGKGKENMVFLHGWGGSAESFEQLAPKIAKATSYEAVVLDLPGFGLSDKPPQTWSTHDYALWLEALLRKLDIQAATLYGHSFGCRVIVRYLLAHPRYRGEVILTGAAGIKAPLCFRQAIIARVKWLRQIGKCLLPFRLQRLIMHKVFKVHDWGKYPQLEATYRRVVGEPDFRKDLEQIKTRVLLIWGEDDNKTPISSAKVFAQHLPHAELQVLPRGRHGIHYTHQEEIVALVQSFLG